MNLSLIFSQMGLSAKTAQDVMLFIVVALVSFVFGMSIGRFKLITVLINIYVAVAILSVFPKTILPDYTYSLILFLGVIVILTVLGKKIFEIPLSGS
jgi:membrane protein implicated in regulation of membrane protease activity